MQAIVGAAPHRLTEYNPAVPAALEALVLNLFEKEPADRPQVGKDLAHVLLDMVSSQRVNIARFVNEMMAAGGGNEPTSATTSGFLPSTPSTNTLVADTHRRPEKISPALADDEDEDTSAAAAVEDGPPAEGADSFLAGQQTLPESFDDVERRISGEPAGGQSQK